MGGTKFFKRTLAFLLAASMMLTQMSFTDFGLLTARAEAADDGGSWVKTNYIVNGDFEAGTNGWTFDDSGAEYKVEANEWAHDPTNNYLNIWTENADTAISVSQTISLPAGKYYFSFSNAGGAKASILTTALANTAVPHGAMTDWDTYGTNTSPEFNLDTAGDYTLTITGTSTEAGYYEKIDNITLYQWQLPPEYSYEDLTALIASVPADYLTMGFKAAGVSALTAALDTASNLTDSSDNADIVAAYQALAAALNGLVFDSDIFVNKVSDYDSNSIRGVDVSSYIAIMDSFDELNKNITDEANKFGFRDFKGNLLDRQGFFNLLADSGVNYIRLRVWNDPYLSTDSSKGYGGGNNDLTKAIEMGKYATTAGMKVLVDFHFSDFWADPGKQKTPKAWNGKTTAQKAAAISEMVNDSLTKLITDNNVAVGMVQIGNETTAGMSGANSNDMYTLFKAGCAAVKTFNANNGTSVLAAIHFTNPEKGTYPGYAQKLLENEVDYDVFASSYYPFWHGTMSNLTSVLDNIAKTYGKYVMVAETSWAYTYADGDGHENTIKDASQLGNNVNYGVSVQDQAKEVRDVIAAVNNVTATINGKKAGLGVFYWEPAWIPVQYAYDENGSKDNSIYESNKLLWEKYGSGWASSYAAEYDAEDAGKWYGGSSWDNQAMFDFNGNPLSSLNVYNYVIYGAEAPLSISSYSCDSVSVEVGNAFTAANLPTTATIIYNDDSTETPNVTWNTSDIANVASNIATSAGIGKYTVNGTVETKVDTSYAVSCTVNIIPSNLLENSSFESSAAWLGTGSGLTVSKAEDPRTGTKAAKFYSENAMDITIAQTVTVKGTGYYNASYYIQGNAGSGNVNNGERIYLSVTNNNSGETFTSDNVTLTGWRGWVQPKITGIEANAGDSLTFTIHVKANGGAWGTVDDASLYIDKGLLISDTAATIDRLSDKQLTAIHTYATDNSKISWTSTDDTIASVDSTGKVTAHAAGKATITAVTNDSYAFSCSCVVTVPQINISSASIVIDSASYTYDGTAKKPSVTAVTLKGTSLTPGTDYTIDYRSNTNAGTTAAVIISGTGNYTGTAIKTFTINKASKSITAKKKSYSKVYGNASFKLETSTSAGEKMTYTSSSKKVVTVDTAGKVKIVGCGTATITVKSAASTNYNAAKDVKITITVAPKKPALSSVTSKKSKQMTVKWKKDKTVTGYRICYSTDSKFKKSTTVKVTSSSTVSKTISKLKGNKKYYVKVCSYTTTGGKTVYGAYSNVKSVTVKK